MVEKIQKAKAYYSQMIQALQGKSWSMNWMLNVDVICDSLDMNLG